jgi:hypothetical protein
MIRASRLGKRGVCAIVTKREAGCDGRIGDARDYLVRTNGADADGEVAWSWPPDAEAKLAGVTNAASDGGNQARSPGRSRISRKTIAQGMPDDPAEPVVTAASFFVCWRAMGGVPSMNDSLEVEVLYPA